MTTLDSLTLAWRTVRSNKLRTGITVAIIAFGIMALIGIITAIEAMNQSLRESFTSMGANAFSIRYKDSRVRMGGGNRQAFTKTKRGKREKKSNLDKPIRKEEAEFFKKNFNYPGAQVSIYRRGPGAQEVHYGDKKTNPQITLWGGDENYLSVNGYSVQLGRNLNSLDIESGRSVCLLGSNVATKLFGDKPEKCIDKVIRVGSLPYRVIGLLKSKGSSAMMRQDDMILTSYTNVRRFENANPSYLVGVMVSNVKELDVASDEATSVFRAVRKLEPVEEINFVIERSDKFAEMFIGFLSSITGSAGAIGLITLIGAAIGLMNIMLVAVNERTKEVGLIKAIGGKSKNVRQQFLFESMIISLLGALFGILLGVLVGNLFSIVLKTGFVVPWMWVLIGIVICSVVGLAAGIYPAMKAARLNPIVALRYE
ncbi:MAG: ABC transporter permease [Chitinophagaceae bacterium]|nr:ABC transporter permease [Chitinophagaceae bacterium]MCA6451682.1 ABC transporter permease [Chitinophagaceae bacterium]MCA6456055.1 ABC transporter permease [Chitinophagaceae bacterium]MCA6459787.1 ABC transporter permease [Chitinophagaceae bacterium]MCA6465896.1 ABC transporter permease [Chitinophagaceae bacterium]